jgi:hypothetical protein
MTDTGGKKKRDDENETTEANEQLDRAFEDGGRDPAARTGKVMGGQRAEYALNPIDDEEAGPEAESETEKEAEEAADRDRDSGS